jgi:ribonuclease R
MPVLGDIWKVMSFKEKDPHFQRESERYEQPIPSREFISEVITNQPGPVTYEELIVVLDMQTEQQQEALLRRLRAMERDGQIIRNRRKGYVPVDQTDLVAGRVTGHPDGFGFLIPDTGGDDLFLSPRQMRQVLHGDRVVARVVGRDPRGRLEGSITEVLERHNHSVVGRYFTESGVGFVIPDNKRLSQDILVPPENRGDAQEGQIVVAAIVEQPNKRIQPVGKIVEILGEHRAPGMEIDIAIRAHELPHEWPQEVEDEATAYGPEVAEEAKQGRLDLRDVPLVTIDGEDARDFDDAVYCERTKQGWKLFVAIADVSHYVEPASALDQEAEKRGTSVYFPERVIPMLPEVLSNGLCSLNPEVDRLCMVCEMDISEDGKLQSFDFHEAVMRSHARLTYNQVAAMVVDRTLESRREYPELIEHLDRLYDLFQALYKSRRKRGAIDFETTETRIVFNEERKIEQIVEVHRNNAHRLIEECMIMANVAAARFLEKHEIPALFRIHEGPVPEKVEDLRSFLGELALKLGGGDEPGPGDYAKLLTSIQEREDLHLIQTVMLRSLKQAIYVPDNHGHFGLSLEAYAHFTSPIRRYPDLLVHRAIRHILRGGKAESYRYSKGDMSLMGEHCSMTERRADEATRDTVDWLKSEYMQDKLGEEFMGHISSVTSFGLFVSLDDIYVEGLVHVTSLKSDYYKFDAVHHRLIGERSGKNYQLGDAIKVRVARVDLDEKKIDFMPAGEDAASDEDGRGRKPKPSRNKGKSKSRGKGKSPKPDGDKSRKKKTRRKKH